VYDSFDLETIVERVVYGVRYVPWFFIF